MLGIVTEKKQKRAEKLSLPPWNSKIMAPIAASANKTSSSNDHISPEEKVEFSELGNCKCSHTFRITCKKSHVFLSATSFFTSALSYMNFQPESCLAVAYSVHFQPLVA